MLVLLRLFGRFFLRKNATLKKCFQIIKYLLVVALIYLLVKYDFDLVLIFKLALNQRNLLSMNHTLDINLKFKIYETIDHGGGGAHVDHLQQLKQQIINEIIVNGNLSERVQLLPPCSFVPKNLVGRVEVDESLLTYEQLNEKFSQRFEDAGGWWKPKDCNSTLNRVALIVPYRNRDKHLRVFLNHMHIFLQKQSVEYSIYVVEQSDTVNEFNRATLLNIGFKESLIDTNWSCFIFHDVDLVPLDDRNLYYCPLWPRHMSIEVSTLKNELPYKEIFGGVSAISREHFQMVNGYSNKYYGWGGEDDDLAARILGKNLKIIRYPNHIGTYFMLSHKKEDPSKKRFELLGKAIERFGTDGLNSLKYKVLDKKYNRLFTWLLVSFDNVA